MTITLAAALAAVRGWTRVYTARMDPPLREARRAEIESDLWELHEDARRSGASPTRIAIHMLLRLLLGIGDDLAWRAEQIRVSPRIVREALWAGAAASVVFVWWLASTLQQVAPHAPADGINVVRLLYPLRPVASVPGPGASFAFARMASEHGLRPPPPPPPPPPRPPRHPRR
jgi:hypothetical protein